MRATSTCKAGAMVKVEVSDEGDIDQQVRGG